MPATAAVTREERERIETRLSPANKQIIERAAELTGQQTSQFVLSSALDRAHTVIEQHTRTTLSAANAQRFLEIIEDATPSEALVRGAERYKARLRGR